MPAAPEISALVIVPSVIVAPVTAFKPASVPKPLFAIEVTDPESFEVAIAASAFISSFVIVPSVIVPPGPPETVSVKARLPKPLFAIKVGSGFRFLRLRGI